MGAIYILEHLACELEDLADFHQREALDGDILLSRFHQEVVDGLADAAARVRPLGRSHDFLLELERSPEWQNAGA